MGTVTQVSRDDLLKRRARILAGLGMTNEDLQERAAAGTLLGSEQDALDELRDIAFLLGE